MSRSCNLRPRLSRMSKWVILCTLLLLGTPSYHVVVTLSMNLASAADSLAAASKLRPGASAPKKLGDPGPVQTHPVSVPEGQFEDARLETYNLSPDECRVEFAGLFAEIDRSLALRQNLGNVTSTDIDISWKQYGVARVMVHDQKLHVIEAKMDNNGYQYPRFLAILHQINRAIASSPVPIPSIEFSFTVDDIPDDFHARHTIWAFSRHDSLDDEMWLMPDFGYWSWPMDLVGQYEQIRAKMRETALDWDEKIPKVLWRGAVKTNEEVRGALLEVTEKKDWADVADVTWKSSTDVSDESIALPITEHCNYQFLIHTEGRSYSGRGKYLLNCASVLISHKATWIEPHSHLLIPSGPHQNFVEVERDFSNLEEEVEVLLHNPQRALVPLVLRKSGRFPRKRARATPGGAVYLC